MKSDITETIKNRINKIMQAQGLKKHTLAEKAGIAAPTIQNWYTTRNYQPTIYSLSRICEVFDIPMSQLFLEEDSMLYPVNDELKILLESYTLLDAESKQIMQNLLRKLRKDCL